MGKTYDDIGPDLAAWLAEQRLFFVATAPLAEHGLINCSPKGMDTFRVLGPREVAYLDLTGSGTETIAHLRENGRIVFTFCALAGPPRIVRLHGTGDVLVTGTPEFEHLRPLFPDTPGARAIIRADVRRVGDSCGYSIPRFEYAGERDTLVRWAENKGPEGLETYRRERNATSLDGLPAFDPEAMTFAPSLPPAHRAFLAAALDVLRADARIVGVAAAGSYAADLMDAFSDLDLVIAVEPERLEAVAADRRRIAAALGPLLNAFTGEHVGEPRLLICLYGPPLLHVDLKFVALPDAATRVDDPVVLLDRDDRLRAALATCAARYPTRSPQWIEDRFWTWIHYVAAKIARGELFEALDGLGFLRGLALGPLALQRAGACPQGVRRLEHAAPDVARALRDTVAAYDARDCVRALEACIDVYRRLRPPDVVRCAAAEAAAIHYLDDVARDLR